MCNTLLCFNHPFWHNQCGKTHAIHTIFIMCVITAFYLAYALSLSHHTRQWSAADLSPSATQTTYSNHLATFRRVREKLVRSHCLITTAVSRIAPVSRAGASAASPIRRTIVVALSHSHIRLKVVGAFKYCQHKDLTTRREFSRLQTAIRRGSKTISASDEICELFLCLVLHRDRSGHFGCFRSLNVRAISSTYNRILSDEPKHDVWSIFFRDVNVSAICGYDV